MLVENSFDLWQKDTFFPAAEEVQKSADIMESAYRTWVRARRDGSMPQHVEELGRELQMALGTAKWQLEELERALRLSYRSNRDHITINRHSQFISAIESQITRIEKAFKESFSLEGKKPFRWVNLNEEECDDLALFLSGISSQTTTNGKNNTEEDSSEIQMPNQEKRPQEFATDNEDNMDCQTDRIMSNPMKWGPREKSALEIVVIGGDDDEEKNSLVGERCKEKVSPKPFFLSSRVEDRVEAKGGVLSRNSTKLRMFSWLNQRLRGGHRSQRQQQGSPVLLVNSTRFVIAFILTAFLVVPFLVYST